MSPNGISPYSLAFPLFSADRGVGESFDLVGDVSGTAFLLGGGFLLTAGHVTRTLLEGGRLGLLGLVAPGAGHGSVAVVQSTEELGFDIGLAEVLTRSPEDSATELVLPWRTKPAIELDDVWSFGFAHGLHTVNRQQRVIQRFFKGHVVSAMPEFEVPARAGEPFPAYELSFPAPRGLSGAPLLICASPALGGISVTGVVVGNSAARMLVYSSEERISEPHERTVVEQYESLTLGVAVQGPAILELSSSLLATTIGGFLGARGKLV